MQREEGAKSKADCRVTRVAGCFLRVSVLKISEHTRTTLFSIFGDSCKAVLETEQAKATQGRRVNGRSRGFAHR